MRITVSKILAAVALLGAQSVLASDVEAGKAKAAQCAGCHGTNGISAIPIYPNLAGQKEAYLAKAMNDFKKGIRKDPTMSAMLKPLSEADIANLAAYYASLKP